MNCPNCSNEMRIESQPDMEYHVCDACGGRFLDPGELNLLATGLAGDIEYCSIDHEASDGGLPVRHCPRCDGEEMHKVHLLQFSEVIFDYCPQCRGFFLDQGELEQMNETLRQLSASGTGEEFREYREDRLVRLDRIEDVKMISNVKSGGATAVAVPVVFLRLIVFFKKPLGVNLRIHRAKWTARLAKILGLFRAEDILTGNDDFDDRFIVHGSGGEKVRRLLPPEVQNQMLEFFHHKHKILSKPGSIEVFDDHIAYTEGPYPEDLKEDAKETSQPLVQVLIEMASKMEGA